MHTTTCNINSFLDQSEHSLKKEVLSSLPKRLFSIYFQNNLKESLIKFTILKQREKSVTIIQKFVRAYIWRIEIQNYLRRKRNYFLLPFNAPPNTIQGEIYLEVVYPEYYQTKYLLHYCKYKNLYVAHLPKNKYKLLKAGVIHFRFVEKDKHCIDPHYEIISYLHLGLFYNSINLDEYCFLEAMEMIRLKNFAKKIKLNQQENNHKIYKKQSEYLKITKHLKKFIVSHPIMAK